MKEIEGNSSTDASGTNVNLAMQMEFSYANSTERVTGRKARGLQTEERGSKCQTFFSLLSGRRKNERYVFPSLYKFKRWFLLKCCVAVTPGLT